MYVCYSLRWLSGCKRQKDLGMKKNILLCIATLLLTVNGYAQETVSGVAGSLSWEFNHSTSTLTISGEGDMPDDIYYPWDKYGYFIEKIIISDGVTSIGDRAFPNYSELTEVAIPNTITSIGDYAFEFCKKLTNITIPNSVTSIGESAFLNCYSLTDIILPNSVTSIGELAFYSCYGLTDIIIPNSVTNLGDAVFSRCLYLASISVDKDNSVYTDIDGVLFTKDKAILLRFPIAKDITKYTIPNSVTDIANSAFSFCEGLTSIIIPNSVTSIGDGAFGYCTSLASISIPSSVTSIGNGAFGDCTSLTDITIPNSVTNIGNRAFEYCTSLASISIPNSVTSIENGTFEYCTGLVSISIPNSVTSIGNRAFDYCTSLASISIPSSVTSIGNNAFYSCESLVYISVDNNNLVYTDINGVLFTKDKTTLLRFPMANTNKYTIPNTVTDIGANAFYGCEGLVSIIIPNSVTSIGTSAFLGCSSLTDVVIPESVISVGEKAFDWCRNLTSIVIPNSVTSIGEYAFGVCMNLTSVTVHWSTPLSVPEDIFSVDLSSAILKVPAGTASLYRTAEVWKEFGTIEEFDGTSIEDIMASSVRVYADGQSICIESSAAETIDIYSLNGTKLYTIRKSEGDIRIPITQKGIVIVTGSSGWTRKLINN